MRFETKEGKKETREFVDALTLLNREAQKGYDKASEYFAKLAKESKKVREELQIGMWSALYEDNDEVIEGREAWEDINDQMNETDRIMQKMKDSIKKDLINSVFALGDAIGQTFAGIEGALKRLATEIAANIGYILMMAGVEMLAVNPALGAGLIVAGGVLQLGSGIIRGLGSSGQTPGGTDTGNIASSVYFYISGDNLRGVLDRHDNKMHRFT